MQKGNIARKREKRFVPVNREKWCRICVLQAICPFAKKPAKGKTDTSYMLAGKSGECKEYKPSA